jgi:spore germination cell wall hydrolase CwlJ-like protein
MTLGPVTEDELLALCVWDEARGEPEEGRAAIARIVLNRMRARYRSDGTVEGTVLAYDQFSGFWFDWVEGAYRRVCGTLEEAKARALTLFAQAEGEDLVWALCRDAAARVRAGTCRGALYDRLTDDVVLYCNLAISHPSWATPDKLAATIGRHSFYRA